MRIAYFAPIYFDYLKQRPQHFAELLSETHEVFYIEPTISLMKYALKGGKRFTGLRYDYSQTLHVIRVNGGMTFHKSLDYFDIFNINSISEYIQLYEVVSKCDLIWVGYPGWYNLISRFKNKPIVYDKMDEDSKIAANHLLKKILVKEEEKLVRRADLIFVSCNLFYERLKMKNQHVRLISNGVSLSFADNVDTEFAGYKKENKIIYGYVGTISHWFDFDVLKEILAIDENNEIVLVGNNLMPQMQNSRIHYVDSVAKENVPKIIQSFDVCLYNFKKDDLLQTINPVKIYEYLALNKPILSVKSKETEAFSDKMMLYENIDEIKTLLKEKLKNPFATEKECRQFIEANSWEARVETIEREIINVIR